MTQTIVIVESPAKAKTINKYLGKDYEVIASFGHIRDLPSKNGSVDPDNRFAMIWDMDKDSEKRVNDIVKAVKNADKLVLSTDPDREGEAISWHLYQVLNDKKALKGKDVVRVTFNEITKNAILNAMKNPRQIDSHLVEAYLARRALDYLVGFTLSPVLWRKLPGSKSAGRVQSVALRLITEREIEIEEFIPQEYWSVEALLKSLLGADFKARIIGYKGKKLQKLDISNEAMAKEIVVEIQKGNLKITQVEAKPTKRNPAAPFITSTLQQEAARKLYFSATKTMMLAQRLYEAGHITYMRTDGVTLSQEAVEQIRDAVKKDYGQKYLPNSARVYKSKAKNAQEAHEAIRPTEITHKPEDIDVELDQKKLYDLIWKRTMACQMESAEIERTSVTIENKDNTIVLRANGSVITFDGFLKVYAEGTDDEEDEENHTLPPLKEGEEVTIIKVTPNQHHTEPLPRYSEASLVKKMEELGIGRPSTYASVLSVLRDRNYVKMDKNRFIAEPKGRIVTHFLEHYFSKYVEYDFTAHLEEQLDKITCGDLNWLDLLDEFWKKFKHTVDETAELRISDVIDGLNAVLDKHLFPQKEDGSDPHICPTCHEGHLSLKLSKYGAFVGCSRYPDCSFTRQLGSHSDDEPISNDPIILGTDDKNEQVSLRTGRYGPYVQLGEGKNPKRASLPNGMSAQSMTLETALKLLILPREIGNHPETGLMIVANIGRYGPYLQHNGKYAKLDDNEEVFTIGINHAVTKLAEQANRVSKKAPSSDKKDSTKKTTTTKKAKASKDITANALRVLRGNENGDAIVMNKGRFGPYLTDGNLNVSIPKKYDPDTITLEEAIELIEKKKAKG